MEVIAAKRSGGARRGGCSGRRRARSYDRSNRRVRRNERARLELLGLSEGKHTLVVFASDNLTSALPRAQHRSQKIVEFRVAAVVASADVRAWVLPNPFRATNGTDLVFTGFVGASTTEVGV